MILKELRISSKMIIGPKSLRKNSKDPKILKQFYMMKFSQNFLDFILNTELIHNFVIMSNLLIRN